MSVSVPSYTPVKSLAVNSAATAAASAASPLSDEERFVCAQLGLSEAEYLAVRG